MGKLILFDENFRGFEQFLKDELSWNATRTHKKSSPFFDIKIKTKKKMKNLRHDSLDTNVF